MTLTLPDGTRLFKALSEVMAAVDRIPKNGTNEFHGYKFATEADVSDALRKELADRDIAVFVSSRMLDVREAKTPRGKDTLLTDVGVEITFACGQTGATFTVASVGTGDDPSDKGTYKAITGAVKYALLKTFLIPTGDDPERAAEHQREQADARDAAFASASQTVAPATVVNQVAVERVNPAEKAREAITAAFDATPADPPAEAPVLRFPSKVKGKRIDDPEVEEGTLRWILGRLDVNDERWGAENAKLEAAIRRELKRREAVAA
jgi:hypothetical protein